MKVESKEEKVKQITLNAKKSSDHGATLQWGRLHMCWSDYANQLGIRLAHKFKQAYVPEEFPLFG